MITEIRSLVFAIGIGMVFIGNYLLVHGLFLESMIIWQLMIIGFVFTFGGLFLALIVINTSPHVLGGNLE